MKQYSFWSNLKFAFVPVWREKRSYLIEMVLRVILSVGVPLAGAGLSSLIIWLFGNETNVRNIILSIGIAYILYGLFNVFHTYVTERHMAHSIEVRLELFFIQVIEKQLSLSLEQSESANIRKQEEMALHAISNNWLGIEGFFRNGTNLLIGIAGLITYSCIAGSIHPWILVILLLLSIISALVDNLPSWYHLRTKERKLKYYMTMRYIDRVVDDIPAGKDIRVFGLKKWLIGKYDHSIMDMRRLNAKRNLLAYVGAATEITLSAARDLVCYLYLIYLLREGMPISQFVFYLGIIGGFSNWFNQVSQNLVKIHFCSEQISDIRKVLDIETDVETKKELPSKGFDQIEIVFDHVSFCYEDAEMPVLKDVSFRMRAGDHIALVGLNGAGKSTMAKLISGLYLPTSGNIYVNGVDTRRLNWKEYFKHQSAIFQDAFILSYTIAENIAFSEEWEEEKIWSCLKEAGLFDKVKSLPDGINTYLGKDLAEEGIVLSGGETQKLLLARALYRTPSLIVLDEPTAALDAIAESEIYEIYDRTLSGVTSMFISHRLASTRFCHNIILLSEGRIAEQGTHDELMEKQGIYYELFKVQSKYYEEESEHMNFAAIQSV